MGKNTPIRKITNFSLAFLISVLHVASAAESKAWFHDEVERVLEKFQRNMDAYYQRTKTKRKMATVEKEIARKREDQRRAEEDRNREKLCKAREEKDCGRRRQESAESKARLHAEVERVLEKFRRDMDAYYQRTKTKRKITTAEKEIVRKQEDQRKAREEALRRTEQSRIDKIRKQAQQRNAEEAQRQEAQRQEARRQEARRQDERRKAEEAQKKKAVDDDVLMRKKQRTDEAQRQQGAVFTQIGFHKATNYHYQKALELFGIRESLETAGVKKAYLRLAMQYHPDKTNGDPVREEKFKEMKSAYGYIVFYRQHIYLPLIPGDVAVTLLEGW